MVQHQSVSLMTLLALVGAGLGMVAYDWFGAEHPPTEMPQPSTSLISPLPDGLEALVTSADLIVVGQVGRVVNELVSYDGFGAEAEEAATRDAPNIATLGFPQLGLPMLDYEIIIDEVVKGHDDIQASGDRLLYRVPSAHDPALRDPNFIQQGEIKLLFLSANPDGRTYGIESYLHMMTIDGGSITYYLEGQHLAPFQTGRAPAFVDMVRDVAAEHRER